MRRAPTSRLALVVVLALAGGSLAAVAPVDAGGVSDQEQTVAQVVAEIDRMHQKVDQYNEDIVVALDQKAELDAQIVVAEQKIVGQQADLDALETQLGNVAVEKVMGGGSGALGPLFTDPVAIDESLQRDHLARVAVDAGAATTDQYETLLSALQDDQRALESDRAQATALAQQAEDSRAKAEQALQDLTAREAKEKAKLGDLIEQEEQRQAAAAAAEYQRQVKEAAAAAAAAQARTAAAQAQSQAQAQAQAQSQAQTPSKATSAASPSPAQAPVAAASSGGSTGSSGSGGSSDAGNSSDDGGGKSDPAPAAPPPVSSRSSVAVNAAASQMGVPYRFATSSPGVSFDCSGLTAYAWGVAGVGLPHQSGQQYASTPHVPKEQAQPGDLIFYYSPISHVGIYIGNGSMIHAPATGKVVSITTVRWDRVVGVSRPG